MGSTLCEPMIYLDNNATTRPLDAVVEAMLPWLREGYGNPSSTHRLGQEARFAVEKARRQVADLLGAAPRQIIFTGGGSESISLALRGSLAARSDFSSRGGLALRGSVATNGGPAEASSRPRMVTTNAEHAAVLAATQTLEQDGVEVRRVRVDANGRLDVAEYAASLEDGATLVSLTHVNTETGVVEDVVESARIARRRRALVHVDAVQSVGKLPAGELCSVADLVSIAAHKFHGPKGVGALFVADGIRLRPLVAGGGQERDLRGGTENVAGIVGMGVAAEAAREALSEAPARMAALRDRLESGLAALGGGERVVAAAAPRVCNTATVLFPGVVAETLLIMLSESGLCASSGSACASGSVEPSHVLLAMGLSPSEARSAVRFSLSRFTTDAEIARTVEAVAAAVGRLRGQAGGR
ncbi:MAG: cysteine desulfurase [Phycisphaerales bacterium]|nr:cysteine desulfurase [Phycisphaerales bacterium]